MECRKDLIFLDTMECKIKRKPKYFKAIGAKLEEISVSEKGSKLKLNEKDLPSCMYQASNRNYAVAHASLYCAYSSFLVKFICCPYHMAIFD